MRERTRRDVLLSTVSAGAFGLAGCIAPDGDGTGDGSDNGTDGTGNGTNGNGSGTDGNDNGTDGSDDGDGSDGSDTDNGDGSDDGNGSAIVDTSMTTRGTDCGSAEDETVAVTDSDGTVTVRGVTPAPNPCHEAVLDTATVADGELSLTVGVEATDEVACIGCTGRVDYEVGVELDGADVQRVTVDHTEGSELSVTRDEFVDEFASLAVRSATIETTGTSCRSGDEETAEIERDGEAVVVTGVLSTSNPCHEAVLGEVSASNGMLAVPVSAQSDGSDTCASCLGTVEYTARIELDDSAALDSVRVAHEGGGTFGAGWESEQSR